ncbi:hypothetical protein [Bosea sp. PAMC 26642]|uniref:hypothetical protein n=1 Tax=Bosea sp. (strain PAMC 26642) TaxID=1792307 RepID=UPI0007702C73|nr:hypothetical protein [Bosea sp. PAMC 26642]AMJ61799.1 hypothetical protein AXW83_17120 [Bosea sp. PAMC 26642]
MSPVACYNLDTRLPRFVATVALDRADALIDILAFDVPDDMARSATVSFVAHAAGLAAGTDIGWRQDKALVEALPAKAGDRLVLAIAQDAVMRAVAAFRAQGPSDGDAAVEIAFTTIVQTPQGARASPKRIIRVTVIAAASAPEWRIEAGEIDLDSVSSGKLMSLGQLAVTIPSDIVLEARRGLTIELGCARLDARALSLGIAAPADPSVSLRRYPDTGSGGCRHLLWLADAAALAGETVRLDVMVNRDAVLDFVDETAQADRNAALQLRLSARLSGWFAQDGAEPNPAGAAKPWRSPLEARSVPIRSHNEGDVALGIAGQDLTCPLGGETARFDLASGLSAEVDPDDESGIVRCGAIAISVRRWPLTRTAPLTVEIVSRAGDLTIAEPPVPLALEIVRAGDFGRHGSATVPMTALSRALSDLVRGGGVDRLGLPVRVEVSFKAGDDAGRAFAVAELALSYARRVHRLPICIDLGSSATSIWSGPPRPASRPIEIRQLALGAWLASHVDPEHDEAGTLESGASALIPSPVGLDSANHLRADHAPDTLPDLGLIGSDRAAAARRMQAFGRRYDVSVPAPPSQAFASGSRRVDGLKRALVSGETSLALTDAVHRLDAGSGRVVATNTVEVAPLFADVLDELVDLYVLRLGEDRLRLDDPAPAPVVPRILIGRPSGIGEEVAVRYGAALALFSQKLERLFPGASGFDDVVVTVPEAVAATRYVASLPETRQAVPDHGEALLVTLDIGGGSDVALARLRREGERVTATTLATFGLPAGGDQIDAALSEVAATLIDKAMTGQEAHWQPSFLETSLIRARSLQDGAAVGAQIFLRRSVQAAKASLSARMLAKAEAAGEPYRWGDGESFDLVLAELREDGEARGLFVAQGQPILAISPYAAELESAGVRLALDGPDAAGTRRLVLRLTRQAIETGAGEASTRLCEIAAVLGGLLPRMARAAAPNPVKRPQLIVVPSGRAALWPPLFEAIASEATASHSAFPFARPFGPAAMKKAVIAGAAMIGMEGERPGAVTYRNPLGIAAMAVRMRDLGAAGLRTEFAAERIHYLGYDIGSGDRVHAEHDETAPSLGARTDLGRRFQFVRTVPGLDPQGRALARLRPLLGGEDPLIVLEGEAVVDATREGLGSFGICAIASESLGPSQWKITVTAADEDWEGSWRIEHDRVSRLY